MQWARIGLGAGEEQRSTSKCRIAQPSRESTEYTPLGSQTQLRLGGTSAPPEAPEQGKARISSQSHRMAWWPSSRGLTGFASAVLRALFDGFDGMVASGAAAARYHAEGGEAPDARKLPYAEGGAAQYADRRECNERPS